MAGDSDKEKIIKTQQAKILQYFHDEKWKNEQEYQRLEAQQKRKKILNAIIKLFPELRRKEKQPITNSDQNGSGKINKVQNEINHPDQKLQQEQEEDFVFQKYEQQKQSLNYDNKNVNNEDVVKQIVALENSIEKLAKYITYRDNSNLDKMKNLQSEIDEIQKQKNLPEKQKNPHEKQDSQEDIVNLIANKISNNSKQEQKKQLYQDIGVLKNKIENKEHLQYSKKYESDNKKYEPDNKKYEPIKEYQKRPNQQQTITNRISHNNQLDLENKYQSENKYQKQHFENNSFAQKLNQKHSDNRYKNNENNEILLQVEKQVNHIGRAIQNIYSEQKQQNNNNLKNNLERKLQHIALEINSWRQGLVEISEIKKQVTSVVENIQHIRKFISQTKNVADNNKANLTQIPEGLKKQISELKNEFTSTEQRNSQILSNMQNSVERVIEKLNQNSPKNSNQNNLNTQTNQTNQTNQQNPIRQNTNQQNPIRQNTNQQNPIRQNTNQNQNQQNPIRQNSNQQNPNQQNQYVNNQQTQMRQNFQPNQNMPNQEQQYGFVNPNQPNQNSYNQNQTNNNVYNNANGQQNTMKQNAAYQNSNTNTRQHIAQMSNLRMQTKQDEPPNQVDNNAENKTTTKNIGRIITPFAMLIVFATSGYAFYDYLSTQWDNNNQNNNSIVTASTRPTNQNNNGITNNIQLSQNARIEIIPKTTIVDKNKEKQNSNTIFAIAKINNTTKEIIQPVKTEKIQKQNQQLNFHYQRANELLNEVGQTQQAIIHLEKAATGGLAVAQYKLALIYENGQGTPEDKNTAKTLYEKAAQQGNIYAMHNLGVIIAEQQENDAEQFQQAIYWFEKAARFGFTDSQFNLAVLYERGLGEPIDKVKAYKWYAVAASNGDQEAANKRDELVSQLTSKQLTQAAQIIARYQPEQYNKNTNEKEFTPEKNLVDGVYTNKTKPSQLVKQIQTYLKKLGFQIGNIDGITGPKTIEAVRRFQRQYGVIADGSVNSKLLRNLISATEPKSNNSG